MTKAENGGIEWNRAAAGSPVALCLLFLTGLLAGCDAAQWPLAGEQQPRPATRQSPSAPASANKAGLTPSTKPAAKPVAALPAKPSAPPVTGTPAMASTTAVPNVLDGEGSPALVGLDSAQTQVMLGPPNEEELRAPAKIWRYRTAQCTLDVALYPDVQTHVFRVLNYEVNGNDGTEQGRRQCIAGLRSGLRTR